MVALSSGPSSLTFETTIRCKCLMTCREHRVNPLQSGTSSLARDLVFPDSQETGFEDLLKTLATH